MTVSQNGSLSDKIRRNYKEMIALSLRIVVISETRKGLSQAEAHEGAAGWLARVHFLT